MPVVSFGLGVNSSPVNMINAFNGFGSVPLSSFSLTQLVYTNGLGTLTIVVSGSGFGLSGGGSLTAGNVSGMEVRFGAVTQFTMTGLDLLANAIQQAAVLDANGFDNAATEDLFLPLGYHHFGNLYDDVLLATSISNEGVLLDFSGNDNFETGGERDNIWLGGGDDTGRGGAAMAMAMAMTSSKAVLAWTNSLATPAAMCCVARAAMTACQVGQMPTAWMAAPALTR
jgi:hypothetical protein